MPSLADVYATVFSANTIERLFASAGAFLYLPEESRVHVADLGSRELLLKGPFTDAPSWAPFAVFPHGRSADSVMARRLAELLDEGPSLVAPLDSPEELLSSRRPSARAYRATRQSCSYCSSGLGGISSSRSRCGPQTDTCAGGRSRKPARWARRHATERTSMIWVLGGNGKMLYVVEPGGWGCVLRAQFDGDRDLRVSGRNELTAAGARELLDANSDYIPQEP